MCRSKVSRVLLVVRQRRHEWDPIAELELDADKFEVVSVPEVRAAQVDHFGGKRFDVAFCAIGTTLNKVSKVQYGQINLIT